MSIMDECKHNMEKALEHYKDELKGMRTNRPSPNMLDNVTVEVYGTEMKMRDVATVAVADGNQLVVTPFDPSSANSIAKSIEKANLNLLPAVDGNVIRVPIPPMSEERRKEIAKDAREKGEKTKVTIRDVRRKSNDLVKKQKGDGEITEDEQKKNEKSIQELTDKYCKLVDELFVAKEKDILEV
ncbi:MAG: ribosome recycling factor [Chlamydiales bacterium]|nr:ribosome recycling factor [Chlamydiales bacterium]